MNIQELKNRLCSKYFETTDLPLEITDGYEVRLEMVGV